MGFRCYICTDLFDWSSLVIYHELNHCPKCQSLMLDKEKKKKLLLKEAVFAAKVQFNKSTEPIPDTFIKEADIESGKSYSAYPAKPSPKKKKKKGRGKYMPASQ